MATAGVIDPVLDQLVDQTITDEIAESTRKAITFEMREFKAEILALISKKFSEQNDRLAYLEAQNVVLKSELCDLRKAMDSAGTGKGADGGAAMLSRDHWPSVSGASSVGVSQKKTELCNTLAAVHNELADANRRKKNIIVTGLQPLMNVEDADIFIQFCESYLPVKPSVVRSACKRLGKDIPGRIQPLLIVLSNEDAAQQLLECASLLRKSDDEVVKKTVYFNPDRTQAEAQAAYNQRVLRHERNAAKLSSVEASNATASTTTQTASTAQETRSVCKLSVTAPPYTQLTASAAAAADPLSLSSFLHTTAAM